MSAVIERITGRPVDSPGGIDCKLEQLSAASMLDLTLDMLATISWPQATRTLKRTQDCR